ncbi:hypothetical protein GCM10027075_00030 [Streptomyces heilongjiangensis]
MILSLGMLRTRTPAARERWSARHARREVTIRYTHRPVGFSCPFLGSASARPAADTPAEKADAVDCGKRATEIRMVRNGARQSIP